MSNSAMMDAIRAWVQTDNEMRELQKKMLSLRKDKRAKTAALTELMKSDSVDRVDLSNGYLNYVRTSVRKPITQKSLSLILLEYCGDDAARAEEIGSFVFTKREIATRESVKRHITPAVQLPDSRKT
jgi:hypothetical protein